MSRRGRPSNAIPTIDWKCHIPIPIATKIDLLLLDPLTGKTRHGSRSAFVTQLLVQFLQQHENSPTKGGDQHGLQEGQG